MVDYRKILDSYNTWQCRYGGAPEAVEVLLARAKRAGIDVADYERRFEDSLAVLDAYLMDKVNNGAADAEPAAFAATELQPLFIDLAVAYLEKKGA